MSDLVEGEQSSAGAPGVACPDGLMGGEEPGVELGGDRPDPGTDQRQGGLDDREGLVREHADS